MSLYDRHILPWLIERACSVAPIARQRSAWVPLARGRVLEIGVGAGQNLRHYDRAAVTRIIGLDISPPLLSRAEAEARRLDLPFSPLLLDAATIPLDDASVDCVVVTFTLCSITQLAPALAEMRRVLHPDGLLLFCEHGHAPDAGVARVQRFIEPAWKPLAGGCHLTRDPVAALLAAGFRVERLEQAYLPHVWRGVGWVSCGVARRDQA